MSYKSTQAHALWNLHKEKRTINSWRKRLGKEEGDSILTFIHEGREMIEA